MKAQFFLFSASLVVAGMTAMPLAKAETVHTKTIVQSQTVPGANKVNFSVFDINQDGMYSMAEVGERLFRTFDQDGNELIDNIEWDKRVVMTVTPMEAETFKFVDYDDDGLVDKTTYTYDTFYEASGLMRFDSNQNGLSAAEFIDTGFQELDLNDNNMISVEEWKTAYLASRARHNTPANYNQK